MAFGPKTNKQIKHIQTLLESEPVQYSLHDQLVELKRVANMTGLYDAADWLQRHIDAAQRNDDNET